MYSLTLVTAPTEEPVTLAELKAWVRQDQATDDALLSSLGVAARGLVERHSGRQLCSATWRLALDSFPPPGGWELLAHPLVWPNPRVILLPKAPLQSVSSVQYYDLSDTLQTLASTTYDVDAAHDPGRVSLAMNKVWPVVRLRPGAVRITFVAGYGGASSVPEELKLAIKMTVAEWYENRGDTGERDLPPAAKALLAITWNGALEYG